MIIDHNQTYKRKEKGFTLPILLIYFLIISALINTCFGPTE